MSTKHFQWHTENMPGYTPMYMTIYGEKNVEERADSKTIYLHLVYGQRAEDRHWVSDNEVKNSIGKRTDLSTHKVHHGVHNNDVRGRKSVFERQRETRGETKKRITRIINVSAKKSYENKYLLVRIKQKRNFTSFFFKSEEKRYTYAQKWISYTGP